MRNQFFFALFTAWTVAWAFVVVVYARATYKSWRAQDGRFRSIPRECIGFLFWFFSNSYQDARHGFRPYPEQIPARYTSGHLLRLFITISAFVAGGLGITSAMIDRDGLDLPRVYVTAALVFISMLAALGHLSVAWMYQPRKWRALVFGLAAWFVAAYFFRGWL